jgi:hypothetical protein
MNGWAIVSADMRKFHYVGATQESAAKWLRYRLKHQARGEQYVGPVEVRVIAPSDGDPPASVPRSEFTGEQLLAAYGASAERERCAKQMERLGQHEVAHCLRNYPLG